MSEPLSVHIRGKPVSVRTVTETGAPNGRDEPGTASAGGASTLTDPAIEEMQPKLAAQREQLAQARKARAFGGFEHLLELFPLLAVLCNKFVQVHVTPRIAQKTL